jgi:hypothetical protein
VENFPIRSRDANHKVQFKFKAHSAFRRITNGLKMWFIYSIVMLAAFTFAAKKWGWQLYHRFGRPLFLRRLMGKPRAATPPLEDRGRLNNEYSVFQVYDDGSIISSRIERPQTVIYCCCCCSRSLFKKKRIPLHFESTAVTVTSTDKSKTESDVDELRIWLERWR